MTNDPLNQPNSIGHLHPRTIDACLAMARLTQATHIDAKFVRDALLETVTSAMVEQARESGELMNYKWQPLPDNDNAKYHHKKDEANNNNIIK